MRDEDDCQHQGNRRLGLERRANPGELLINVVRTNKPKVLKPSGLSQKASGLG